MMKRIALLLISGMIGLLLSSCNNDNCNKSGCPNGPDCQNQKGGCTPPCCPFYGNPNNVPDCNGPGCPIGEEQKAAFEKWAKFNSLSPAEQKALIAQRKAAIDKREADKKKAQMEFETKWTNFDKLSVAEQKKLIDQQDLMCPFWSSGCPSCFHGPKGPRCHGPKCGGPQSEQCPKEQKCPPPPNK